MKPEALIGLGSNLGDRLANLRSGVRLLVESGTIGSVIPSSLYASDPVECEGGEFFNAVVSATTNSSAYRVLEAAREVERTLGRTGSRGDARPLDVDILYFGDAMIRTPRLCVPHPSRFERAFVLVPLGEVCREGKDPETGRLIRQEVESRAGAVGSGLRKIMGSRWLEGDVEL